MRVGSEMPSPRIMTVEGVGFPCVAAGTGDPVLFVHGSWADYRAWCDLWQDVAAQHRFMAYTHRHFGKGHWPKDKPFSCDVHSDDLVAILRELGEPVHLVGWSYSGAMVLGAAREVPELVRKVVIYEPSLISILKDTPEIRAIVAAFRLGFAAAYSAAVAGDTTAAMHMAVEFVFGLEKGGFRHLDPRFQTMFLDNAHTMLPDFEAAEPVPLTCEDIGGVSSSTLLIVGEKTLPHYKLVAEILACLPDGAISVIEGVGHGGPWLAKAEFVRLALKFIDKKAKS